MYSSSSRSMPDVCCHQSRYRDVPESRRSLAAFMPAAGAVLATFHSDVDDRDDQLGTERNLLPQPFEGEPSMHFCLTGQYTPRALNAILENPATDRQAAAKKLIEAAGGKLVSMYSSATDG